MKFYSNFSIVLLLCVTVRILGLLVCPGKCTVFVSGVLQTPDQPCYYCPTNSRVPEGISTVRYHL